MNLLSRSFFREKAKRIIEFLIVIRLRISGVNIGKNAKISRSAKIDQTNPTGVSIGNYVLISSNSMILSHDFVNQKHVNTFIGSNVFIGANVIILPGVKVHDNVIIGAGSIVTTDIPPNVIMAGNPAKVVKRNVNIGRYGIIKS